MRNHALTVTGGAVTGAARVDGQSGVWQITVTPSTRGELSIYLDPTTDCEATGAVCPSDNRALSTWFLHLLLGPPTGLSVSDAETRESEDTTLDFVVTLSPAASGQVTVDYATSDGTATAGADYTATDGTLTFEAGEATKTISVPITDDTAEDDGETVSLALSNASGAELGDSQATGTIRDMESDPALTASFEDVPASHDGKTAFTFGLTFSADVEGLSFRTLRDEAFEVTGGELRRARRRTKGSNQAWDITVNPASDGAVTIRLPQTTDCEATGAVCTADDRPLPTALSAAVSGPVGISVADARVEEGAGAVLAFAVTLSRAASGTVAVDYEAATAQADPLDPTTKYFLNRFIADFYSRRQATVEQQWTRSLRFLSTELANAAFTRDGAEVAAMAAGTADTEHQVEQVVLRIHPAPEAPHGATADFDLVHLRQGQETRRERWSITLRFTFLTVIPSELVVYNPMGILITYLQADRALVTEPPR